MKNTALSVAREHKKKVIAITYAFLGAAKCCL
nr:MAG TPA: hypothetical protein [Caudoviricetes sp.]